jgi:hypothetical protein
VVVKEFPDVLRWLFGSGNEGGALFTLALLVIAASTAGVFFGFLWSTYRNGPVEAFYGVARVIGGTIPDWIFVSFRRIGAIARLSVKEAIRRRVILVAFIIFALTLLVGGWFVGGGEHPDRVYINFVMWGTQLLLLVLVMLISAFSLPDDIRNRTIYTVATKPVRTSEMLLGRIAGFGILGTVLLFSMGVISLLFVWRGLSHTHQMKIAENGQVEFRQPDRTNTGHRASDNAALEAVTTTDSGHFHYVEVVEDIYGPDEPLPENDKSAVSEDLFARLRGQNPVNAGEDPSADGQEGEGNRSGDVQIREGSVVFRRLQIVPVSGHAHDIEVSDSGNPADFSISGPLGFFRARLPKYAANLVFFDREGETLDKGFSTGDIWTYLGYIDGGTTLSRAEYLFNNLQSGQFGDAEIIPLELSLGVFRSTKGDIYSRVRVGLQFESVSTDPEKPLTSVFRSEIIEFESQEHTVQVKGIPRTIPGYIFRMDGELVEAGNYDLFDDYAQNGELKLVVRCLDENQYLGMARASIYFRQGDQSYVGNFVRGYFGIWMQMMIVICLGVSFSTFLSSPVTMLASICAIVFGFFSESINKLVVGEVESGRPVGGGPIESFYRLIIQKGQEEALPRSLSVDIMERLDSLFLSMVGAVSSIVPDFSRLDFSDFLTYGYFVDGDRLMVAFLISLAFCIGLTLMGYFFLKTRELAG